VEGSVGKEGEAGKGSPWVKDRVFRVRWDRIAEVGGMRDSGVGGAFSYRLAGFIWDGAGGGSISSHRSSLVLASTCIDSSDNNKQPTTTVAVQPPSPLPF
jgi:hypothetical protein